MLCFWCCFDWQCFGCNWDWQEWKWKVNNTQQGIHTQIHTSMLLMQTVMLKLVIVCLRLLFFGDTFFDGNCLVRILMTMLYFTLPVQVKRNLLNVSYHIAQYTSIISDLRSEIQRLKKKIADQASRQLNPDRTDIRHVQGNIRNHIYHWCHLEFTLNSQLLFYFIFDYMIFLIDSILFCLIIFWLILVFSVVIDYFLFN